MQHSRYLGLAELVRPIYFEQITSGLIDIWGRHFGLSFELDRDSLSAAARHYQDRASRLLHPTVINVLDAYAHSIVTHLKVSANLRDPSAEKEQNDPALQFFHCATECIAVHSAAFLFQREVSFDIEECGFDHDSLFEVAQQIQRDPERKVFDLAPLANCRQVRRARNTKVK